MAVEGDGGDTMLRLTISIGLIALLGGCASTGSLAVRPASDDRVAQATKAGIIEALGSGLFSRVGNGGFRRSDRILALEAEYRALEHTPAGRPVRWRSESGSLAGEVVAAQPYRVGSQDCRPYRHTITGGGKSGSAKGTACRNADGSWTPLT